MSKTLNKISAKFVRPDSSPVVYKNRTCPDGLTD